MLAHHMPIVEELTGNRKILETPRRCATITYTGGDIASQLAH